MSNFLWHHGLYSPRNSPGQKLEWVAFPCAHGISKVSPCTWSPLARGTTQRCLTFQDWFLCSYPILQFWSLGTGVMLMPKRQWCWKLFLWIFFHQRKSLFHLHMWRIVSLNIGFCFCFLSVVNTDAIWQGLVVHLGPEIQQCLSRALGSCALSFCSLDSVLVGQSFLCSSVVSVLTFRVRTSVIF